MYHIKRIADSSTPTKSWETGSTSGHAQCHECAKLACSFSRYHPPVSPRQRTVSQKAVPESSRPLLRSSRTLHEESRTISKDDKLELALKKRSSSLPCERTSRPPTATTSVCTSSLPASPWLVQSSNIQQPIIRPSTQHEDDQESTDACSLSDEEGWRRKLE